MTLLATGDEARSWELACFLWDEYARCGNYFPVARLDWFCAELARAGTTFDEESDRDMRETCAEVYTAYVTWMIDEEIEDTFEEKFIA